MRSGSMAWKCGMSSRGIAREVMRGYDSKR
jgi:hypothetical protein